MKNNWKKIKLSEFCKIKGGKRLPFGKSLSNKVTSHPYIRVRDLTNIKTLNITSEFGYIDNETYNQISRYIVNTDDVIISIVGTVGLVSIIGSTLNNTNLTENCAKLVNLKNIDNNFLYYYLVSSFGQDEIKKNSVGGLFNKNYLYME